MDKLNEYADKHEFLKSLTAKTGIPGGYFIILSGVLAVYLIYNGIGGLLLLILIGFLYPGYMLHKGLKDKQEYILNNYTKYWVVLSIGVAFYEIVDWFIPEFPLLGLIGVAGVIFLVKSEAALAVYLYDSHIAGYIAKLEGPVDSILSTIKSCCEKREETKTDKKD